MKFSRKNLLFFLLVSTLFTLLSSSAYASTYQVTDIYYQRTDDNFVRIDYAQAIDDATGISQDSTLYDASVEKVREALDEFKTVLVKVDISGDIIFINYGLALEEGRTLDQAVGDDGEDYHDVDEPEYTYELVVQDGTAVEKSVEYDWLEEDGIIQVWDELGEQLVVYVILTDDLPDDKNINDVDSVLVKGKAASKDPNKEYRWRVSFTGSNWWEDAFVVTENDIVLVIDGQEYSL